MRFITYMILFRDGYLYTGCTGSYHRRRNEWGRKFGNGYRVVYRQVFESREEALGRERQIKGWSRAKKEALIVGDFKKLAGLAMRRGGEFL
jgi:predicted GIY-YIG superfamily endonuclease